MLLEGYERFVGRRTGRQIPGDLVAYDKSRWFGISEDVIKKLKVEPSRVDLFLKKNGDKYDVICKFYKSGLYKVYMSKSCGFRS